jgi:hypothetical protein
LIDFAGERRDERRIVVKHRHPTRLRDLARPGRPGLRADRAPKASEVPSPADTYAELFHQVQMRKLFPDGKTFVDATPKRPPAQILAAYRAHAAFTDAELKRFVRANFVVPKAAPAPPPSKDRTTLKAHIAALWPVLTRPPVKAAGRRQRPAAGQAVRGARRALPRDVLLGQLLHDAGPGRRRPPGRGREHGRRLRRADRPLRPHPQRHAHLLSQPLAAAVLLRDGRGWRTRPTRRGSSSAWT